MLWQPSARASTRGNNAPTRSLTLWLRSPVTRRTLCAREGGSTALPGELTCARASGSTALPGELTMSSSVSSSCLASNPGVVHSGVVAPNRSAPPRRCAESGRHWRTALTSAAAFGENGTACTDARTQSLKLGDGACDGPTSTLAKSTPTRVARGRPADRNLPAGHSMHSVRPLASSKRVAPQISHELPPSPSIFGSL